MTTKLKFPTHLRKMWSGSEVQEWLDKQEQEPVANMEVFSGWEDVANVEVFEDIAAKLPDGNYMLYAAPVRTKDLTDDELDQAAGPFPKKYKDDFYYFARAVIAADRELNR